MPRARGGRRPRRRSGLPGHHRRLHRRRPLGASPGRAGHAGRQADAGVHQARPVRRRRGAGPARGSLTASRVDARPAGQAGRDGAAGEAPVPRPCFDIDAAARALAAQAALEPREASRRGRDVDADGVPCRLYRPAGADRRAWCTCTAAASSSTTSTPTTRPRAGWPTGPGLRCSASTTADRRSTRSRPRPRTSTRCSAGSRHADPRARRADVRPRGQRRRQPRAASRDRCAARSSSAARSSYHSRGDGVRPVRGGLVLAAVRRHARDLTDPDLAPLLSDRLGTLPPTLVVTAEHDVLARRGELLAARLAGGRVAVVATRTRADPRLLAAPRVFDAAERRSTGQIAGFVRASA